MNLRIFITITIFIIMFTACNEEVISPISEVSGTKETTLAKSGNENIDHNDGKFIQHKGEIFFYPTAVEPTVDPLVVRIYYEGEGKATHFGHFTETGEYFLHSDAAGTPLFISDVIATRFTANGDEVYLANVTGTISLTGDAEHPMILEGDYNYDGGTGRFKKLCGNLHWRAVGNADGSAVSNFKGEIWKIGREK